MGDGWIPWIFVKSILLLAIDWRGLTQGPDCWESCFEPGQRMDIETGRDKFKDEYRDVRDAQQNANT